MVKYLYRTMNGLAVLCFLTITPADAQKPALACKLLQPAEIESALGGKAVQKSSDVANNGGIAMDVCNVEITRQAGTGPLVVTIQILTNLPLDGGDMLRARNRGAASEPQWKGAGAQFEEKTVGNTICTRYGRPGVRRIQSAASRARKDTWRWTCGLPVSRTWLRWMQYARWPKRRSPAGDL